MDLLHLNLIALQIAHDGDIGTALAELNSSIRFYRHMAEQSNHMVEKIVGVSRMADRWWLMDTLLSDVGNKQLRTLEPSINNILHPPSAELLGLQAVFRYEYQAGMHLLRGGPRFWYSGRESRGILRFFAAAAYVPQATANLFAQRYEAIMHLAAVPAHLYEHAKIEFAKTNQSFDNLFDIRSMGYNYNGKVLVSISIPNFEEYILRLHDYEAMRRFFALKLRAKLNDVDARHMSEFLVQQPHELQDPYTNKAFFWNPKRKELGFKPRSNKWKDRELIWHIERIAK